MVPSRRALDRHLAQMDAHISGWRRDLRRRHRAERLERRAARLRRKSGGGRRRRPGRKRKAQATPSPAVTAPQPYRYPQIRRDQQGLQPDSPDVEFPALQEPQWPDALDEDTQDVLDEVEEFAGALDTAAMDAMLAGAQQRIRRLRRRARRGELDEEEARRRAIRVRQRHRRGMASYHRRRRRDVPQALEQLSSSHQEVALAGGAHSPLQRMEASVVAGVDRVTSDAEAAVHAVAGDEIEVGFIVKAIRNAAQRWKDNKPKREARRKARRDRRAARRAARRSDHEVRQGQRVVHRDQMQQLRDAQRWGSPQNVSADVRFQVRNGRELNLLPLGQGLSLAYEAPLGTAASNPGLAVAMRQQASQALTPAFAGQSSPCGCRAQTGPRWAHPAY